MKVGLSFEHCGVVHVEIEKSDGSGICRPMEFTNYYTFIMIIFIFTLYPKIVDIKIVAPLKQD